MIPIHLALPAILASAGLGWAIDRALGGPFARHGALGWSLRVLAGLVAVLALLLHPLALAALTAIVIAIGRGSFPKDVERDRVALSILAVIALVAWARPAVPLYWDEHIWLAKVRLAAGDPLALRAAALDPSADVIPGGYPILASLAESFFAMLRADTASLVAGALALTVLAFAVAITMLPSERRVTWTLALALVPLAWIHVRSAHLDLVVGLLAVAVGAGLARSRGGDRGALHAAGLAAFLLAGTKDEGIAHVVALCAAHAVLARDRAATRDALSVVGAALVAALSWRALLAIHGVDAPDHAIQLAGLAAAPAIAAELVRAATDVASWGAAWPLAIAACVVLVTRDRGRGRYVAISLLAQAAVLAIGLLAGTERLRAFALDGTLANRLLIQLLPMAAWALAEAWPTATAVAASRGAPAITRR